MTCRWANEVVSALWLLKMMMFVSWLLNVPATCQCISGTDLLMFSCCHTETEVADHIFYLVQPQYTDTWPTSPTADPITPGAWQGSLWSANFKTWYGSTRKKVPRHKQELNPGSSALKVDALITRPTSHRECWSINRREQGACYVGPSGKLTWWNTRWMYAWCKGLHIGFPDRPVTNARVWAWVLYGL